MIYFVLGYLTPKFMYQLARKLSTDWKQFGTCLGFPFYTLNSIEADNWKTVERGLALLNTWKHGSENPGSSHKYEELKGALSAVGREDIVDIVRIGEQEYVTTFSPTLQGMEANRTYVLCLKDVVVLAHLISTDIC